MSKQWTCPFCLNRNPFPAHYAEHISENNLPAELIPQFTTLEYQFPGRSAEVPTFLYVVDAALPEDELDHLKDSIAQSLNLLPPQCRVGLITYGTMVCVHELGQAVSAAAAGQPTMPKCFVFKGTKDADAAHVANLLGISAGSSSGGGPGMGGGLGAPGHPGGLPHAGGNKFLMPVGEAAFVLEGILEDLRRDPWPCPTDQRPARASGVALSVAMSMMSAIVGKSGGRILLFSGGPCTVGPGAVVARSLTETMRSHSDLLKNHAPFYAPAKKFYEALASRCSGSGHAVDYFGCSLDQLGLLEMRSCVNSTGGLCVMADSFGQSVFKESFRRVFKRWEDTAPAPDAGHLLMGFGATLEVVASREYKISGAIGPCTSLKRAGPSVSDLEIGEGGTHAWQLGAIDPSTSIGIYFDIADKGGAANGRRHHMQLITYYQHSSGRFRMRVTTTAGVWNPDPNNLSTMAASFDQEAAAVLMARIAVSRADGGEEMPDILRWLDKSLIRLSARFAEYRKDDPSSFRLAHNFGLYPQFMFHLRRSQFMQVFNSSPDESAYSRWVHVCTG